MSRQGRKPSDPPVRALALDEVFADLREGAREARARRRGHRQASAGLPPTRRWRLYQHEVFAHTRSEARALIKARFNLRRIAAGLSPVDCAKERP